MPGAAVSRFDTVTIDAVDERAVALRARGLAAQEKFRIYADPVGQLFCLCSR